MRWATVLLVIVWLGIAAGVTIWALRARRDHHHDLSAPPEALGAVDVADPIDLTETRVDDRGDQRRGA